MYGAFHLRSSVPYSPASDEVHRYVQNERIYISALSMPHLQPYLEVGYGIGTHILT